MLISIDGFWGKNKKSMLTSINRKFIKKRTKNIILKINSNLRNKTIFYCSESLRFANTQFHFESVVFSYPCWVLDNLNAQERRKCDVLDNF